MFYKISHDDAAAYLCEMLPQTVGDRNDYNLRSAHKMDMPLQVLNVTGDHFFLLLFVNEIILLMIL